MSFPMRVLLITSRYPLPPWRGNQVRTLEWIQALADHDPLLLCPQPRHRSSGDIPADAGHYRMSARARGAGLLRALVTGRPLQEGLYDVGTARRTVAATVSEWRPDVVVVQMVRCAWAAEVAREAAPSTPLVFDAIDAMGLHFERAAETAVPPFRPALRSEAARCRRLEATLVEAARLTTAVSQRDLAALGVSGKKGRVVPVAGRETSSRADSSAAPVVLLSGNLGYRPTVRGALWFAREVWPELRRRVPRARWVLAGARPATDVRRLARLPGVEVHADVPDLGAFLALARVAIAPMSSGSGVPMKALEAMAAGLPVVADPWAAAGLEEPAAVAAAGSADEWVETLARLCRDPEAALDLGERGHALWRRVYHPERVAESIREAVTTAAGG